MELNTDQDILEALGPDPEVKISEVAKFVLSGNAYFTIRNEKTGNRFTFRVAAKKEGGFPHFVSVLNGSDNTNDYAFIGTIFTDRKFVHSRKSSISDSAPSAIAFKWFISHMDALPEFVSVYHMGRCGRCGRSLTVPESIQSGFGPECAGRM